MSGCDPCPSDVEQQVTARGFVALWRGQKPEPSELGASAATIETLRRGGRVVLDAAGHVVGIHGLTTGTTPHTIRHAGGTIHTWCAFDAIGIPAALGIDAESRTTCPSCGRELVVRFTDGQPAAVPDLRLWMPTNPCDHVLDDFCAHANLYCDEDHLAAADAARPGTGVVLTVADAAREGRSTWADVTRARF